MNFDIKDYRVLRLCGLCRYIPSDLWRYYSSELFSATSMFTLEDRGYIKMQTNGMSYKLTYKGREALAEMGFTYSEDMRMDTKRATYKRRLMLAHCNVTMHLAGIDVFCENTSELAGKEAGFLNTLMLRTDNNVKALAGTRFAGILKTENIANVVYYVENAEDWIVPGYERETFTAELSTMRGVKDIQILLAGKDLEELWNVTHPPKQSEKLPRGMTLFDRALEELGYDYLLVPIGRNGVTQLSVMKLWGYSHRLATSLGRVSELPRELSFCDSIIDGEPFIFTIDMNVKRIERALRQLKRYDSSFIPNICCFPFQKDVVGKIVKRCGIREKKLYTLEKEMVEAFFPETAKVEDLTKPYMTKEGRYVCADEKKVKRTNSKASEA